MATPDNPPVQVRRPALAGAAAHSMICLGRMAQGPDEERAKREVCPAAFRLRLRSWLDDRSKLLGGRGFPRPPTPPNTLHHDQERSPRRVIRSSGSSRSASERTAP